MTRAELVNIITVKCQMVQPSDVAACQLFLSKRYELIYNSYLWKDSLLMISVPFDPVNNQDNAGGVILLPQSIDRVVGVRTPNGSVRIQGLEYFYRIDFDAFLNNNSNLYGAAAQFSILSPIWFVYRAAGGLTISAPDDPITQFKIVWRDSSGTQYVQLVNNNITLAAPASAPNSNIEIESFFKPVTQGVVTFSQLPSKSMAYTDTSAPSYQRIRIFSIPTQTVNVNVLGKKPVIPFDYDTEVPAIKNLDNCLIALTCGDMWERGRQVAKAQTLYQEGAALLVELAKLETVQAANYSQIIPDGGYGDPYFNPVYGPGLIGGL